MLSNTSFLWFQLKFSLTSCQVFLKDAQQQQELLAAMYKKLETLYASTAKYFAFDPKKYTMEEFFSDMKTFKDSLQVSL